MKKRDIILTLLLMIIAPAAFGQGPSSKHAIGVSWGISVPMSKDNFMNKGRWVAPAVSYEYTLARHFSLAASLGYEYGQESQITSDRFNGDLLDGYTIRQLITIPIQAQVLYFFRRDRETSFQPYLSGGVGVNYAKFKIEGDLISPIGKSNWGEIFTAQAGSRYHLRSGKMALDASLFWQYAGNGFVSTHTECQQNLGIRIGLIFCAGG